MSVVSVNLNLAAPDAASAIRDLTGLLSQTPEVTDPDRLLADILARETLTCTFLGSGLAFPHARTDAVKQRVFAIGRSTDGVPYGAGGERAHLIVLIGCPKHDIKAYLDTNRKLLRRLRDPAVRAELMTTSDPSVFPRLLGLDGQ
ncbi:MAG: PTS sugar transporter subunit IIA [Opitutales bacterium]|jgi:mannitol/fructose-specific phosphotransferase system IIA component (Ntr-type)